MMKLLLGWDFRNVWKLKLDHLEEYGSLSFMGASLLEQRNILMNIEK